MAPAKTKICFQQKFVLQEQTLIEDLSITNWQFRSYNTIFIIIYNIEKESYSNGIALLKANLSNLYSLFLVDRRLCRREASYRNAER